MIPEALVQIPGSTGSILADGAEEDLGRCENLQVRILRFLRFPQSFISRFFFGTMVENEAMLTSFQRKHGYYALKFVDSNFVRLLYRHPRNSSAILWWTIGNEIERPR